ncbi:MAG TPA: hypothetical protein VF017_14830 [Thermoanaerobaculia bacterium]|nr:hypothetical protein [Thermoanaerobaculia bacterium]
MSEPQLPRRGRRLVRVLGLVLAGALLLEGLYLVAANAYLRSESFARLVRAPHRKTRITAECLFSPFPGFWRATQLELRGQTPRLDWWLHADRASGWISLPALLGRRLVLSGARGDGIDLRLTRRDQPPRPPEVEAALPSLPEIEVVPRGTEARRRFEVELADVSFTGVREIWLDVVRLTGRLSASGGFRVRLGETAEVFPSTLVVEEGQVHVGDRLAADALGGRLDVALTPYRYRDERGWQLAPHTSGRVTLDGGLADLSILDPWLGSVEWLRLRGGEGPFRLAAGLEAGEMRPGSSFELMPRPLDVWVLGYHATGAGSLVWSVPEGAAGLELAARLPSFAVRREGEADPYLVGKELSVRLATTDRRLDGALRLGGVWVDFPAGEVADLRTYNVHLPARLGLAILSGRAEVAARFESPDGRQGTGSLRISAPRAVLAFERLRLAGDLEIATVVSSADLPARRFGLDGTTVRLAGVTVSGGARPSRGWWGTFTIERGTVTPRATPYLEAGVRVRLRDSGPLVDLLTERRSWPLFVAKALTVDKVEGTARLSVARQRLDLETLHVRGGKLGLDARLRLEPGGKRGQLLAQYGRWALGLELDRKDRDWILLHPRRWFTERTGIVVEAVGEGGA